MLEICIPLILVIAVHGASVQTANKEVAEDQPVVLACSFDGFSNNELEGNYIPSVNPHSGPSTGLKRSLFYVVVNTF